MRHSHIATAGLLLAFQLATLSSSPWLLVSGQVRSTASLQEEDACCSGLAPGQMCPMHKHRNGGHKSSHDGSQAPRGCRMIGGCVPVVPGLESFAFGLGTMPPVETVTDSLQGQPVLIPADHVVSRSHAPDLPPPRA